MKRRMKKTRTNLDGGLRTRQEQEAAEELAQIFDDSPKSTREKLDHFTKYVRRQRITRFLSLYELFKLVLPIKGSIIECGVYEGFDLMTWAQLSAILEPVNLTRRIYGFDTFEGFPSVSKKDESKYAKIRRSSLSANSHSELEKLIKVYDSNRFLGHVNKVALIKGDARVTIPAFLNENKHLIVSLLFLDFDLFEPTRVALDHLRPRMCEGAVIAFDELDNPIWPGETLALLETIGINNVKIQRFDFDPYIGYIIM